MGQPARWVRSQRQHQSVDGHQSTRYTGPCFDATRSSGQESRVWFARSGGSITYLQDSRSFYECREGYSFRASGSTLPQQHWCGDSVGLYRSGNVCHPRSPEVATEKDFLEAVNKVIKSYAKFSATPRYMTYN